MVAQGYVRFPSIHQDRIAFVSEDDLWLVSDEGGRAERLTNSNGLISHPHFSPDGQQLAFVGREEGPREVYVMPVMGGPAQRLTFDADFCTVLGWSRSGEHILYASSKEHFSYHFTQIYTISPQGGPTELLPIGRANAISYGPNGGIVIGRNIEEAAYWKRYRGGRVGHLWCDVQGTGTFKRLLNFHGNVADPCWVGERIYFLSDHEGIGNIYSCTPEGEDLHRHSDQQDFYARHLSTDGQRLVFCAGADLYLFDPRADCIQRLHLTTPSQRTQLNRKFASAEHYLDTYDLHPEGHAIALTTRGKAFSMSNWEGAVLQHGEPDGVRYRFLTWLNDGQRLVAICDAPGRETLVVFDPESDADPKLLTEVEFGRCTSLSVSPEFDLVAIANHRHELILVDLENAASERVDRSDYARIYDLAWSSDSRWLAYSFAIGQKRRAIKLYNLETGQTHIITNPVLEDTSPSFDPAGKYLYFLGQRIFNPVRDAHQFDYSFPRGIMPYAIPLQRDLHSPFIIESKLQKEATKRREATVEATEPKETNEQEEEQGETNEESENEKPAEETEDTKKIKEVIIDLEGIIERAQPFPVKEARYDIIRGIKGKVLLLSFPIDSQSHPGQDDHGPKGVVESYDLETQKIEKLIDGADNFKLSRDNKTLLYSSQQHLRVLKAGEKPPRGDYDQPSKENAWLNLNRIKVSVRPMTEWQQMFAEAWRLQREQFWTEDMSGVDWDAIYAQYRPLLDRIGSRAELSDLIHELQGELGTSHAYESGGEYRTARYYRQGFLGIDWLYDATTQRYRVGHIVRGEPSDNEATSPLTLPGLGIAIGDAILAVNGQRVGPNRSPQELLVYQADREVQLTIESAHSKELRIITVPTLTNETKARYREWVEQNRQFVHQHSNGRVGYIHIPDMGLRGFAEFHRSYLMEYDYPALVIDVRWNTGGHVSELLLEKLARKRIGYSFSRWGKPEPYPEESPHGPMVALANEHTCSNGDIFSHAFKLMKLGPLIGKRTWGGVIGILPRHRLVDHTRTTQPEYANWFMDVGWHIENYGTDPDIEVDISPQDYANGTDPQLERAIAEALRIAETYPILEPIPGEKPRRNK